MRWDLTNPWARLYELNSNPVIRHYSVRAQTLTLRYVHSGGVGFQVARFEPPSGTGDLPGKRALLVQLEVSAP
jgi:hypothetical protein